MNYQDWIRNNDCGCGCQDSSKPIDKCDCDNILLEISNLHTDDAVISGEVDNIYDELDEKLDITAYTPSDLSNYYNKQESDNRFQPKGDYLSGNALNGYATEQWVENKGYLTDIDLSSYALKSDIPTVPTNVSDFVNDAGYLTEHQPLKTINNQVISGTGNIVIEASGGSVTVDESIDSASTNPVENKAIYGALNGKLDASAYTPTDLSNYYNKQEVNALIPTVPSNVSAFLNDAHYVTNSELMQYISNLQGQITSLIATVSGCCSETGETQYRWVTMTGENDYWCSGTTKMAKEKEQSSTDGINWADTGNERSGSTVLEENCEDCGYVDTGSAYVVVAAMMNTAVTSYTMANQCFGDVQNTKICVYHAGTSSCQIYNVCYTTVTNNDLDAITTNPYRNSFAMAVTKNTGTIRNSEFSGTDCYDMELVSGITTIEANAFSNNQQLAHLGTGQRAGYYGIPLTRIGDYAFANNPLLTEVSLYGISVAGLTTIPSLGADIFYNCPSLTKIYVDRELESQWKAALPQYASIITSSD